MTQTPLQARASQLQQELSAINHVESMLISLRQTFAEFPGLRDAFAAELELIARGSSSTAAINGVSGTAYFRDPVAPNGATVPQGTNKERIEAFFASRGNTAATVIDISKATGIPQASVRHMFSARHPELFEKVDREGERLSRWRIKHENFQELIDARDAET